MRGFVLSFGKVPAIGTEVLLEGQPYNLVDVEPYTRLDGVRSKVLIWEAPCSVCGDLFRVSIPVGGSSGPNRRCKEHRKPGIRCEAVTQ